MEDHTDFDDFNFDPKKACEGIYDGLIQGYVCLAKKVYHGFEIPQFLSDHGLTLVLTSNGRGWALEGASVEPIEAWQHSRYSHDGKYCLPVDLDVELEDILESFMMDIFCEETPGYPHGDLGCFIAEYHQEQLDAKSCNH